MYLCFALCTPSGTCQKWGKRSKCNVQFRTFRPSQPTWAESQPVGCHQLHPPSPFIINSQPKGWYSFYGPKKGRRLSWPRSLVTPRWFTRFVDRNQCTTAKPRHGLKPRQINYLQMQSVMIHVMDKNTQNSRHLTLQLQVIIHVKWTCWLRCDHVRENHIVCYSFQYNVAGYHYNVVWAMVPDYGITTRVLVVISTWQNVYCTMITNQAMPRSVS